MATMQNSLIINELCETTLFTWKVFLRALKKEDLVPHVGPTSAMFVSSWPTLPQQARAMATTCLEYIIVKKGNSDATYLDDIVDMSVIPELFPLWKIVADRRANWTPDKKLEKFLGRLKSDNAAVITQALVELKVFMLEDSEGFMHTLTSGDIFDPLMGDIVAALFCIASKNWEGSEDVRALTLECIGICGALDPDRLELDADEHQTIMKSNFRDESESVSFAIHLIKDVLVGAFRSTCDIAYQNFLAYAIQELLKFCRFTPALITPGSTGSLPIRVRNRWKELPRPVKEIVTPLLAGRYSFTPATFPEAVHPIYPTHNSYREWLQAWTAYLLDRTSGEDARTIFSAFYPVIRNKDVGVAHHLLPHLVLNVLLSGNGGHIEDIRTEILTVLEDQVNPESTSTADKKELSAQVCNIHYVMDVITDALPQAVFMLMDHLNGWVRQMRQGALSQRRRQGEVRSEQEQLLQVDSILSSINQNLVAKAALTCKAYARALMCFEQQLYTMSEVQPQSNVKIAAYETLHEIYAQLDEPDGMEGITALIVAPSLEHQIREHESTGRWTSAQSCWEVKLQSSPNDIKSHLGLLRCLRSLGHYGGLLYSPCPFVDLHNARHYAHTC
jgi:serine/threonine-protein kinase ATR